MSEKISLHEPYWAHSYLIGNGNQIERNERFFQYIGLLKLIVL